MRAGIPVGLLLSLALTPTGLVAQNSGRRPSAPDSVTVVADSSFERAGFGRWLLGDTYRDLWTTPIRVEVLDPDRFAGGLTPLERGGGLQTVSLRLQGADGKQYQFRLLRKNPVMEEPLNGSLLGSMIRDQMSANLPASVLILPTLMQAAGILHALPLLRLMPDHPRLGEFRAEFGNQVGTIEERPTDGEDGRPGFAGSRKVESTEDLLDELRKRPWVRVDTRTFLATRLIDLLVGDWDRHEDQYRWAVLGEGECAHWQPIPRDRDQAFARFDGALLGLVRVASPKLLVFDEEFPTAAAATHNGRHLDRRILSDLEWAVWDSILTALQATLTDAVLDRAVDQLPPEYEAATGAMLRRALRTRRDDLRGAAEEYYRYLAGQVFIHAGDEDDQVDVERHADGRTEISVRRAGDSVPYFHRSFTSPETQEIRIFLYDGIDRARVWGEGEGPKVRIIGGPGADTLLDESIRGKVRFYDEDESTVADGEPVDRKPFVAPRDTNPELPVAQDWGGFTALLPRVQFSSHSGVAIGVGMNRVGRGFRRFPYASLHSTSLDYSFRRSAVRFLAGAQWQVVNRPFYFGFQLRASGIEGGRFAGYGNTTMAPSDGRAFLALRDGYEVRPFVGYGLESTTRIWLMLRARHTVTDMEDPFNVASILSTLAPFGIGDVGQAGPAFKVEVDTRNTPVAATRGVYLELEGDYYPLTWSGGAGAFGAIEGKASTYFSPLNPVSLALRVGGRRVWGEYPYFEAAYLGGKRTLRGYHGDRFAGDRALFGNAELRLKLADNNLLIPIEVGVLGLADVGRVWFEDEPDSSWHSNLGAGLWFGVMERKQGLSFGLGRSVEGTRFWLVLGTPF